MLIAGIDPGADGGLAILDEKGRILDLRLLRAVVVKDHLVSRGVKILWIEKAQAMGKESPNAMFSYGRNYGYLLGTLANTGIEINFVPPSVWTRAMHVHSAQNVTHKKSASESAAKMLWPEQTFLATPQSRKAHDGLYEAALIAYYGLKQTLSQQAASLVNR